jgi:HK97 family phage portal protein
MYLYESHAIIYAIINKITKRVASKGYKFIDKEGEAIEDANTKRIEEIFKGTTNDTSLLLLLRKCVQSILITGDTYLEKVSFNPRVARIDYVSPKWMKKKVSKTGEILAYTQTVDGKVEVEFTPDEMYSEGLNNGEIYGVSPVRAIWKEIKMDIYSILFNTKFFENSATPTTIFHLKPEVQNMTTEQKAEFRKQILDTYQGALNQGKPMMNNLIESVTVIERDLEKMQFLDSRDKFIEKACSAFDISKVMLGLTDSANEATASNSMRQEFYLTAVRPYEQIMERFINDEILPDLGFGEYRLQIIEQDFTSRAEMVDTITKERDSGLITTNQARAKLGETPIEEEWADKLIVRTASGYVLAEPVIPEMPVRVDQKTYNQISKLFYDHKK